MKFYCFYYRYGDKDTFHFFKNKHGVLKKGKEKETEELITAEFVLLNQSRQPVPIKNQPTSVKLSILAYKKELQQDPFDEYYGGDKPPEAGETLDNLKLDDENIEIKIVQNDTHDDKHDILQVKFQVPAWSGDNGMEQISRTYKTYRLRAEIGEQEVLSAPFDWITPRAAQDRFCTLLN